ncbi:MAG TPA: sulfatase-like hydrolase/transferase, partial [Anseongella sp.]|nr:sulfatase-like hydrolase/transferase [Anseongella sp.]
MAKNRAYLFPFLIILSCPGAFSQQRHPEQQKPNILYILTDDLGYGDLGVFFQQHRQEINDRTKPFMLTPYLDEMAAQGAILSQYCAAPVCAPSRASLLLGVSQGHANVRDNQFDKGLEDNYTLGNVMQKAGYATAAIGKWGLQGTESTAPDWPASPLKRGFHYYYGYIAHGHGHEHYPKEGLYRKPKPVWENTKEVSAGLDNCYTGDLFTALAKKYIIDHEKKHRGRQPFFLYLAYDTPHAVLELPTQAYPEGKGLKGGLRWLGTPGKMINTASGIPDSWVHPDYANSTYDHDGDPATPEAAWPDTYKRYATIVRRIDSQVGDILQLLKDLGIAENTLVVFTSDNGPSKESYLPEQYTGFSPAFFGGFGPFDGIKRDVWEGGVRMPALAWWPGRIPANTRIETPSISYDWMPTFTAMA